MTVIAGPETGAPARRRLALRYGLFAAFISILTALLPLWFLGVLGIAGFLGVYLSLYWLPVVVAISGYLAWTITHRKSGCSMPYHLPATAILTNAITWALFVVLLRLGRAPPLQSFTIDEWTTFFTWLLFLGSAVGVPVGLVANIAFRNMFMKADVRGATRPVAKTFEGFREMPIPQRSR